MKIIGASAFGFILLMFTTVAWTAPVPDNGQTKRYVNIGEICEKLFALHYTRCSSFL